MKGAGSLPQLELPSVAPWPPNVYLEHLNPHGPKLAPDEGAGDSSESARADAPGISPHLHISSKFSDKP